MDKWEILIIIFAIIRNEIFIFLKRIYSKLNMERYDIILNSEYIKKLESLINLIKEELKSESIKFNINLFHNGGNFIDGVCMLKYSTVYFEFNEPVQDVLISNNKELFKIILQENKNELVQIKENLFYRLIFDKNNKVIGFIELNQNIPLESFKLIEYIKKIQ